MQIVLAETYSAESNGSKIYNFKMADFVNLQVYGVPILTYGLIGVTTAVLAYATSIGMGDTISKSMGSLTELTESPMSALSNMNPLKSEPESKTESKASEPESKTDKASEPESKTESEPESEPTGLEGLNPVASEDDAKEKPTTGGKKRRKKTPKSKKGKRKNKSKKAKK